MEKPKPPAYVYELSHIIDNGNEEEAVKARNLLRRIQSAAGKKGQAALRNKLDRQKNVQLLEEALELEEFIQNLLAANAHLLPRGELPDDIEALLEPHRLD